MFTGLPRPCPLEWCHFLYFSFSLTVLGYHFNALGAQRCEPRTKLTANSSVPGTLSMLCHLILVTDLGSKVHLSVSQSRGL